MTGQHETIEVHCHNCRRTAQAERYTASVAGYEAEWVRIPAGWWQLMRVFDSVPTCRCDRCKFEVPS